MIGVDTYYIAYCLKKPLVFALSIKDIQYQTEKKTRAETNPKSVVPHKYLDFLDVFSKKDLNTFLPHQKYDHKIHPEEEQKPSHELLYKISLKKLDAIKWYLDFHLAKRFI